MLGLEIRINDEKPIIVSAESAVYAHFAYGGSFNEIRIGGSDNLHYLTWFRGIPEKGDKVLIRVVETEEVSPVLVMKDCDRKEMKKWYEHYKAELQEKGLI